MGPRLAASAASKTVLVSWLALALASCGGDADSEASAAGGETETTTGGETAPAPQPELPNGITLYDGVVTGGQPDREALEVAQRAGYRTVVSLRVDDEAGSEGEAELVDDLGMRFVSIPVDGAEGLTRENVQAMHDVLSDPDARPMILHCGSGNRVGALVALRAAWLAGATPAEALELGRQAGLTRLEPTVRTLLEADDSTE